MKRLRLLTFALIGWGTGFGLLAEHGIASTYTDGKTTITIYSEKTPLAKDLSSNGHYVLALDGRSSGSFQINSVSKNSAYTLYKGRFNDIYSRDASIGACVGDISIRRANLGTAKPITAEVVWRATGGKSCRIIGQTVRSTMNETLPRPNTNGDFTPSNANTYLSETNGMLTWIKWQVVDNSVNCRVDPNGAVKQTYPKGQITRAETRGGNAFTLANDGSPWLLLVEPKRCYVRANKRYILPVSLP